MAQQVRAELVERLMLRANLKLVSDQVVAGSELLTSTKRSEKPHRHSCWRCQDVGYEVGAKGARQCKCQLRKIARSALAEIPPRFSSPKLSRLVAQSDRHEKQAVVIEEMRLHPERSYLFCGTNGSGKTHFAWALYRYAVSKGRQVVACSVRELLEYYRKASIASEPKDSEQMVRLHVLPNDLKMRGARWTIFLDEFEKARPSEFAAEMLFALLDAAYQYNQQLIVTSNFDIQKLIAHWGRLDEVWGTSIVRRLDGATLIEMF